MRVCFVILYLISFVSFSSFIIHFKCISMSHFHDVIAVAIIVVLSSACLLFCVGRRGLSPHTGGGGEEYRCAVVRRVREKEKGKEGEKK